MGKSYKFKIGDWVKFKKYYKVATSEGERYAYEIGLSKPIIGKICGAVIRHLGKIEIDQYDYHAHHPYLVPNASMILYQIRTGMINVPYEVKEEDIEAASGLDKYAADIEELPWKYVYVSQMFRNEASEYAKDMPRDENGKFLKEPIRVKES